MTGNKYQQACEDTAIYPNQGNNLYYPTLGLAGEAGEIANKVKKIMRDDDGVLSQEKKYALAMELGDVLWYVAALASELGINLDTVMQANLEKLQGRKAAGTLKGEGDQR